MHRAVILHDASERNSRKRNKISMCNSVKKKYAVAVDWGKAVATNKKSYGRIIWHNDPALSDTFIAEESVNSVGDGVRKVLKKYADDHGVWSDAHTETPRQCKDGFMNREEDIEVSVYAPCRDSSKGDFVRVRAQESWV